MRRVQGGRARWRDRGTLGRPRARRARLRGRRRREDRRSRRQGQEQPGPAGGPLTVGAPNRGMSPVTRGPRRLGAGRARLPFLPRLLPARRRHDGADSLDRGCHRGRPSRADRALRAQPVRPPDVQRAGAVPAQPRRRRRGARRDRWRASARWPSSPRTTWPTSACGSGSSSRRARSGRLAEYEQIPWWKFIGAASRSDRLPEVPRRRYHALARRGPRRNGQHPHDRGHLHPAAAGHHRPLDAHERPRARRADERGVALSVAAAPRGRSGSPTSRRPPSPRSPTRAAASAASG